jgi:hypothetical protein
VSKHTIDGISAVLHGCDDGLSTAARREGAIRRDAVRVVCWLARPQLLIDSDNDYALARFRAVRVTTGFQS